MKIKKESSKKLSGRKLVGSDPARGRVEHDWYATDPKAVQMLFDNCPILGHSRSILEPCVGGGHVAKIVKSRTDYLHFDCLDIVDRGYEGTEVCDFLEWKNPRLYDLVITNPPYSLATEFVKKSKELLYYGGYCAMFLKVQFLESEKRADLFEDLRYVYVFRKRMSVWNRGREYNPDTGKKWVTTMCHAWFIWHKGYKGEPVIRWL